MSALSREHSLAAVEEMSERADRLFLDLGNALSGHQRGRDALTLTQAERDSLRLAEQALTAARNHLTHAFVPWAER